VAIKHLPEGISAPEVSHALVTAWEHWYGAPHPGLLKPLQLDLDGKLLVREWVWGFSLLDLLRHRHRLEAAEAVALLEASAATMDHAQEHGLMSEARVDKWFAEFADAGDDGSRVPDLDQPLDRWPAWRARLDPLRLSKVAAPGNGSTTQIPREQYRGGAGAVAAALDFLRELLGASVQRVDAPLAALNDSGNSVLMAARKPGEFASARDFHQALADTIEAPLPKRKPAPPVREYALVPVPANPGPPDEKLLLEPASPDARPIQLVHRDELRLGRSSEDADLALRFTDRSEAGTELTKRLSRVHARLRREGEELRLLDGNGSAPSGNGTFTREGQLTDPSGLPLRQLALVQLGAHWRATLAPTPSPEEARFREESQPPPVAGDTAGTDLRWGAVFVLPASGCRARVETVWLLEEAGFGLASEGVLAWDWEGIGAAPAAFRVFDGRFCVLNRRLENGELSVDLLPVNPGAACMLGEGMLLAIGHGAWRIRIA
jgi:hypothetical protein